MHQNCWCEPPSPRPASLQAGLGVAVEYYLGLGSEAVWARIQTLASLLRIRLAALPGVTLHDAGRELCGIVAFTKVHQAAGGVWGRGGLAQAQ